ncbi:MAG: universal stress protein [Kofleriaceae bacterium]|nr:universal stress protein [Kofleriaceae bacterium]
MAILCGTDLSEASGGALDVARALASRRGDGEVFLVHVASEDTSPADLERMRNALDALAARHAPPPVTKPELIVGEVGEAMCSFADTEGGELIVIAHRSTHGPLVRLGSTAAKIIQHAAVPVACLRDPAPWLAFAAGQRPLRVLIGIDDSSTCDLGIQWVHALRKLGPVEVVLGAIYYPDDAANHYGIESENLVDRHPEIEALLARDLMRKFGGDPTNVVARPRRGLGRIGDHMIELARDEKIDVIVVGTAQKTGMSRLGSVSSVIVEDAEQSVVCVPPNANIPTITVPVVRGALAATDLSAFANRAVAYAFGITEPDGDVHIVHVVDEDEDLNEAELRASLLALAPAGTKQKVHAHIVRGEDAATALAQTAARQGVDVICISSHGRSGIARALVGSVADRLLRATRLPVLVLRPA